MKRFDDSVLEMGACLSLCLMLAILMGVPALWSLVGAVVLLDLGVILYLRRGAGPTGGLRIRNVLPQF
ncbi:MAG: hypothetical protein ACAH95_06355 [Fimbriimonas sp.]